MYKIINNIITTFLMVCLIFSFQMNTVSADQSEDEAIDYSERVIAHGGGFYKGYETTNTIEALNNSITNGYSLIELDLEISSDGEIIMLHDWDRTSKHYYGQTFEKPLSKKQFAEIKVHNKFETLDFEKLTKFFDENKDFKIVTDTKGDNVKILSLISKKYPQYVKRIIPQIYSKEEWQSVKDMGFDEIILTIYKQEKIDCIDIAKYARDKKLFAIAMPDYAADLGYCKKISDFGIKVYVHPVSSYEKAMVYLSKGAFGVYSSSLLPAEFDKETIKTYIQVKNDRGQYVKLTDSFINNFSQVQISLTDKSAKASLYLDGKLISKDINNRYSGLHNLELRVLENGNQTYHSINYIYEETDNQIRIMQPKYEYRISDRKFKLDFEKNIRKLKLDDKTEKLLSNSLIVKRGDYRYFYNGKYYEFKNGNDFIEVQKEKNEIITPFYDIAVKMGAKNIIMDQNKDISFSYNNGSYRVMIDSYFIREGFKTKSIKNPATLYLDKTMANAEIYEYIFNKESAQSDDVLIMWQKGYQIEFRDKYEKKQFLDNVTKLFDED